MLKNPISKSRHEEIKPIKQGRPWSKMVFTKPSGCKRDQGQPKKQMQVGPQNAPGHILGGVKHVVVVVPVYPEIDKA